MAINQSIAKLAWTDLRDRLYEVEPEFTDIVDELRPGNDLPLFVINFPYGEMIGDDISQFLPDENGEKIYRLNLQEAPADIIKHLGYGMDSAPLGMVLSKSIEFFVDLPHKELTIPIRVAKAGEFYNFSRILSIPSKKSRLRQMDY